MFKSPYLIPKFGISKQIQYLCFSEQFSLSARSEQSVAAFLGCTGFSIFAFKISKKKKSLIRINNKEL